MQKEEGLGAPPADCGKAGSGDDRCRLYQGLTGITLSAQCAKDFCQMWMHLRGKSGAEASVTQHKLL